MKVSEHCVKSWQQPLIISAPEIHSVLSIFPFACNSNFYFLIYFFFKIEFGKYNIGSSNYPIKSWKAHKAVLGSCFSVMPLLFAPILGVEHFSRNPFADG